jgi:RNAse (barnase) inhibitor barstar
MSEEFEFDFDLNEPSRSGVYRAAREDLDTYAALARDAELRVLRVDLQGCNGKHLLLARLAAQLDFPGEYGRNWDALADALRDLSWLPCARGYALLLDAADSLRSTAGSEFDTFLEILDETAVQWAEHGITFAAFVALDPPAP